MRTEIKIYIKNYCKIYNIKIEGKPSWDKRRKRWNIPKYVTKSWRLRHQRYGYYDNITKAYNYVFEHACDCPEEEFYHKMREME